MRYFFLISLLIVFSHVNAQKKDSIIIKGGTIDGEIFQKVDVEPSVDMNLWRTHLETNLQSLIEKAAKKGMKAGAYTVNVRFLVERDGSIADVKALNDPGFGLGKGSVRVVKTGPRWKPGMVNGRVVRSYHTQPISFVIAEE